MDCRLCGFLGLIQIMLIATVSSAYLLPIDSGEELFDRTYVNNKRAAHVHVVSKRDLPSDQFKLKCVSKGGIVSDTCRSTTTDLNIEVAATNAVPELAHSWAANVVARMTKFMPSEVFNQLGRGASVGIFTAEEGLAVYPEYTYLGSTPDCKDSCAGNCSGSCTFDGRKFSSLAGLGGQRAVDLLDNLMCTDNDPYGGTLNGLVHEFSHTVHRYGLAAEYVDRIAAVYADSKANETWITSSYAMSTVYEFFACASSAYFNADTSPRDTHSGGLNSCSEQDSGTCPTEKQARAWLNQKSSDLFDILSYVYNNRRMPSLFLGGITTCPPKTNKKKKSNNKKKSSLLARSQL